MTVEPNLYDRFVQEQKNFLLSPRVKAVTPRDAESFSSDDAFEAFREIRWGWTDGRAECRCGSMKVYGRKDRVLYKCAKCSGEFSLTSNTAFNANKLPYPTIVRALSARLHSSMNAHELHIHLGVNYRTAARLSKVFCVLGNIAPKIRDEKWPFLSRQKTDGESLVGEINALVPRNLPEQVRADVCQDLILGVLSGDFTLEMLKGQVRAYVRRHYRDIEADPFKGISFDQTLPGDGDQTFADIYSPSIGMEY